MSKEYRITHYNSVDDFFDDKDPTGDGPGVAFETLNAAVESLSGYGNDGLYCIDQTDNETNYMTYVYYQVDGEKVSPSDLTKYA